MLTPELYDEHKNAITEMVESACRTYRQDGQIGCFCRLVSPPSTNTGTYRIEVEHAPDLVFMLDYDTESSDQGVAATILTLVMWALAGRGRFVFTNEHAWNESGGETQVRLAHGGLLCYRPDDSTVCIRDHLGTEIVRWVDTEIQEDPLAVIDAIFGAAVRSDRDVIDTCARTKVVDGFWR